MKKWHLFLILLVLPALAALWALAPALSRSQPPETAPPVVVPVTRGDVQLTVTAPGVVVGVREWWVTAGPGGLLAELRTRPGDPVRAGQRLALISETAVEGAGGAAGFHATTPFDGVILEVAAIPGEHLPPHAPLLHIGDPRAVEVQTTVIEEDLPLVQVGQEAELYFDAYGDVVPGTVTRIVPRRVPGEARPLYYVYVAPRHVPAEVLPGMTADAALMVDRVAGALRLPVGLLRFTGPDSAEARVWRPDTLAVETRAVRTGLRGDVYVEILEGLLEGDEVVGE